MDGEKRQARMFSLYFFSRFLSLLLLLLLFLLFFRSPPPLLSPCFSLANARTETTGARPSSSVRIVDEDPDDDDDDLFRVLPITDRT